MLEALEAQTPDARLHPTPLGRSLGFGRTVGALAVLRINRVLTEDTAIASLPATTMDTAQIERMWTRLTIEPTKRRPPR